MVIFVKKKKKLICVTRRKCECMSMCICLCNIQNHLMQTIIEMLIPQRVCAMMLFSICSSSKEGLELALINRNVISYWKHSCNLGCIYTY